MTEQEYINVSHLTSLVNASKCLNNIVSLDRSTVTRSELSTIRQTISNWINELLEKIKTEE